MPILEARSTQAQHIYSWNKLDLDVQSLAKNTQLLIIARVDKTHGCLPTTKQAHKSKWQPRSNIEEGQKSLQSCWLAMGPKSAASKRTAFSKGASSAKSATSKRNFGQEEAEVVKRVKAGVAWALYAEDSSGQQLPQSDQCHQCFELWTSAFSYYSWEVLCQKHASSTDVAAMVSQARAVKQGSQKAYGHPQQVCNSQKVLLQVERNVVALSEKELRKVCKMQRIGKTILDKIPSFLTLSEDGQSQERIYAFLDTACGGQRRAKLVVTSETGLNTMVMPRSDYCYAGQGNQFFEHASAQQQVANGVKEFLERDGAGHSPLISLEDFMVNRLKVSTQAEEEDLASEPLMNPIAEAGMTFVGVAAAAANAQSIADKSEFTTPSTQKKKQKPLLFGGSSLVRSGSGVSSSGAAGSADVEEQGRSVASESLGDVDGEDLAGAQLLQHQLTHTHMLRRPKLVEAADQHTPHIVWKAGLEKLNWS
eukprot:6471461-Amphidinium_carterae.4